MSERLPDVTQTDFSGGEINFALKRRDNLDFVKTGARQCRNWRIEAGGTLLQRPGKRPLFPTFGARNDYVRVQSNAEFILTFGQSFDGRATITISNLDGTALVQYASPAYSWTRDTLDRISWCLAQFDIMLCYPGMQPQIVRWNPASRDWTFLPYTFRVIDTQTQEPFYRFGAPGATMAYDGYTGNIGLTCSQPYFNIAMVGSRLSIVGQQVTITSVSDPQHARADVAYRLPDCVVIQVGDTRPFQPGMIAELRDQDLKFEVGSVGALPNWWISGTSVPAVFGIMLSNLICDFNQFTFNAANRDVLISPLGSSAVWSLPFPTGPGQPTVEWTEEFMCAQRGWPSACAYTAGRLCFYGFPQMQEAILWSAVGANDVCWVDPVAATNQAQAGAEPDSAILEFESSKSNIVSLLEWGDIFVFSDRGIFFIPVSQANPLSPGNVEFRRFSNDGVSTIRPVSTQDAIVYINAGLNRCSVVKATGSLTRPYISDDVSESHAPLFTSPRALAIATGDGVYPERYVYVVNDDGTLAVGKFTQQRTLIGWVPWTSTGLARWVTNAGSKVWFTSLYVSPLRTAILLEIEDPLYYLDGMVFLNQPAPGMAKPGFGPLWHLAGMTVQIVDQQGVASRPDSIPNGCVDWGDRQVDANGWLIPEPTDVMWTDSPTVYAGLWSPAVFEPFIFPPREGSAKPGARGKRRKLQRAVISVEHSNGFSFGKHRIPPVNWLEDPTRAQQDPPFPLPPDIDWKRDWKGPTGPDPNWQD